MRIQNFEIDVVCANYDKNIKGYGDIYTDIDECEKEHPNDKVIFGFHLRDINNVIETPDWFDSVNDAVAWVLGLMWRKR